jgi:hypothetical protein
MRQSSMQYRRDLGRGFLKKGWFQSVWEVEVVFLISEEIVKEPVCNSWPHYSFNQIQTIWWNRMTSQSHNLLEQIIPELIWRNGRVITFCFHDNISTTQYHLFFTLLL